jgi:immunity protein 5 of polymorphic toxin system
MTPTLFKVTGEDGSACHGGSGRWDLPKDGKPGAWKTVSGKLIPCERGLHLCRPTDLVYWLGPAVWEAEVDGDERIVVDGNDGKVVVRKARLIRRLETWNERTARLFAVECAERVLPIFEKERPGDDRPRTALAVARSFADGLATQEELAAAGAAARAAARDAAGAAAWAAAGAAAGAAARDAARDAAWTAAGAAARTAAWAAARDAAWTAEHAWQTTRLCELLGIDVTA